MKTLISVIVIALTGLARASQIDIIGFDTSQGMQFQGGTISNFFSLEFSQHPDGPWTNWGSVSSQSITGSVMSLPSPFFFRIAEASESAFPPYATGTPVYVESDPIAMNAGFLTNAISGFGVIDTNFLHNTIYQATTDGLLLFTPTKPPPTSGAQSMIQVGASTNSLATRVYVWVSYVYQTTGTCPVKAGEYWRTTGQDGSLLWMPLQ